MPAVYTPASLAEKWGCSVATVRSLVTSGELVSFRLGVKLVRIRADEVERFEQRSAGRHKAPEESPKGKAATDNLLMRQIRLEGRR
jgi:excisionase family DNA binding protein